MNLGLTTDRNGMRNPSIAWNIHKASQQRLFLRIYQDWISFVSLHTVAVGDLEFPDAGTCYGKTKSRLYPIHIFGVQKFKRQCACGYRYASSSVTLSKIKDAFSINGHSAEASRYV